MQGDYYDAENRVARLRDIQSALIDHRRMSGSGYNEAIGGALHGLSGQLVRSVYELEDIIRRKKGDISRDISLAILQLDNNIDQISKIIRDRAPVSIVQSIIDDARSTADLIKELSVVDVQERGEVQNKVEELQRVISDYRRQVDEYKSDSDRSQHENRKQIERYKKIVNELESKASNVDNAADKVLKLAGANTSKNWTDEYLDLVELDDSYVQKKKMLEKKSVDYVSELKKVEANKFIKGCKMCFHRASKEFNLLFYFVVNFILKDRLFYGGKSYASSARRWRIARGLWLFLFFVMACVYIYHFNGYDFVSNDVTTFFIDKTIFLPLLIVMSVGFTLSARSYRIYSHLNEQYRHRFVVAKILSNLMALDDLKGDGTTKMELIQQATKILFEFKQSGYMNKHDGEGLPASELSALVKQLISK